VSGLLIERTGEIRAGALVVEREGHASVLQIAAHDTEAAGGALLAAAGGNRSLRLTNVSEDEPASSAMRQLGARLLARQHELKLTL
jgi:hypothetical protein